MHLLKRALKKDGHRAEPARAPPTSDGSEDDEDEEAHSAAFGIEGSWMMTAEQVQDLMRKWRKNESRRSTFSGRYWTKWLRENSRGLVVSKHSVEALSQYLLERGVLINARNSTNTVFSPKHQYSINPEEHSTRIAVPEPVARLQRNGVHCQRLTGLIKEKMTQLGSAQSGDALAQWLLYELTHNASLQQEGRTDWTKEQVEEVLQYMLDIGRIDSVRGEVMFAREDHYVVSPHLLFRVRLAKALTGCKTVGEALRAQGTRAHFPVVMIPGLASSALEVWESDVCPSWQFERVWLDVLKIGEPSTIARVRETVQSMLGRKDVEAGGGGSASASTAPGSGHGARSRCYSIAASAMEMSDRRSLRTFLHHMCLSEDLKSDPPGIKVRPCAGLGAINNLSHSPVTRSATYVWAYVIRGLMAVGYDQRTMRAAPYDWRLPLFYLEERDGYFSDLRATIESLYGVNGGVPVVVMAHSMGNRVFQYFLLWMRGQPGGQRWIDTHVHAFLALGAPFLGAPKTIRGTLSGDSLGLEMFLSDSEALDFGRRLGSLPCLFPLVYPLYPQALSYLRLLRFADCGGGGNAGAIEERGCAALLDARNGWAAFASGALPRSAAVAAAEELWETFRYAARAGDGCDPLDPYTLNGLWQLDARHSDAWAELRALPGLQYAETLNVVDGLREHRTLKLRPLNAGVKLKWYSGEQLDEVQELLLHRASCVRHAVFGPVPLVPFFANSAHTLVAIGQVPAGMLAICVRMVNAALEIATSFKDRGTFKECTVVQRFIRMAEDDRPGLRQDSAVSLHTDAIESAWEAAVAESDNFVREDSFAARVMVIAAPVLSFLPEYEPLTPTALSGEFRRREDQRNGVEEMLHTAWGSHMKAQTGRLELEASYRRVRFLPTEAGLTRREARVGGRHEKERLNCRYVLTVALFGVGEAVTFFALRGRVLCTALLVGGGLLLSIKGMTGRDVCECRLVFYQLGENVSAESLTGPLDPSQPCDRKQLVGASATATIVMTRRGTAGTPGRSFQALNVQSHAEMLECDSTGMAGEPGEAKKQRAAFVPINPLLAQLRYSPSCWQAFDEYYLKDPVYLKRNPCTGDERFEESYRSSLGSHCRANTPPPPREEADVAEQSTRECSSHSEGDLLGALSAPSLADSYGAQMRDESMPHPSGKDTLEWLIEQDLPPIMQVPPVKRLWCVYGFNRKTEVSYYFREKGDEVKLDRLADKLSGKASHVNPAALVIRGGVAFETKDTPQPILDGRRASGDGTVPYCSLAFPRLWQAMADRQPDSDFKAVMIEVENAEHRSMMRDEQILFSVLSLVCNANSTC